MILFIFLLKDLLNSFISYGGIILRSSAGESATILNSTPLSTTFFSPKSDSTIFITLNKTS